MKICNKCKTTKDLNEFSKNKRNKDGLRYICKQCVNKHYKDNKEHYKQKQKEYYKNHKNYYKEYNCKYYKQNNIILLKRKQNYYKDHKEKIIKYNKEYQQSEANYNTYASQISWANDPVRDIDGFLQTKCTYCGKWYFPTTSEIRERIKALNGKAEKIKSIENRLYCSTECKEACPIFHKYKYQVGHPKLNENTQVREVQSELRQMVFERDEYTCIKCGKHQNDLNVPLHCHHIEGIKHNPIESADIDMCVTVCKICHKEIHQQKDCSYNDMKCKT